MINKTSVSALVLFLVIGISCLNQKDQLKKNRLNDDIDHYINNIMQVHQIPGLAIAVVRNGNVAYTGYYGQASIESNDSINEKTVFRVYSATKLITTVGVFQLIEKGKIALEDEIVKYLDNLPDKWQKVKVKNLLTHSSGLPDLIRYESTLSDQVLLEKLFNDEFSFDTGYRFQYNQTNYWLLARILEKISESTYEDYILNNQFFPVNEGVLFSSNSLESIPDRGNKYYFDHEKNQYQKTTNNDGTRAHAGNGLNITLDNFIEWNKSLDDNLFLKKETKSQMWAPFEFGNGKDKFRYGWGVYPVNNSPSIGFTGGGVCGFRKFTENDVTVIVLTNGFKYFPVHDKIINRVAGMVDNNLSDQQSLCEEDIILAFLQDDIETARQKYYAVKDEYPDFNFENTLNSLGYALLRTGRLKDAIKVFELNAKENPNSWNVFDSLAEGYFKNEQYELSIQNYIKSLYINPKNSNATEMISKIEQKINRK